jgi:hypothetical protein
MGLAVDDGGQPVGSATWSVLLTRDGSGAELRVGFIGHLEVHENLRRNGYGTLLLERLLTVMWRYHCEWALALPGHEAGEFYARLGWQAVPLLVCEGRPRPDEGERASMYAIREYDPTREPHGWAALADVYAADSARRPLSVARDADYWARHVAKRVSVDTGELRPRGTFLGASMPGAPHNLTGYVLVHWWHVHPATTCWFEVTELCVRPGQPGLQAALLAEVGKRAAALECSMAWGRMFLPRDAPIESAIEHVLRDSEWSTFVELRARPLGGQAGGAWFAPPGASYWSMDVL